MPWPTDSNGNCWGSEEYVEESTYEEIKEQIREDKHRASYNYPGEKKQEKRGKMPQVCCNELLHGAVCRVCNYNWVRQSYE